MPIRLIHERVRATLAELRADTDDDTPLVVLAHSFGGQIMSNYIWDLQVGHETAPTAFERMETLCGLVTFGSNIPLFLFAYEPENIHPISYPGTKLPNRMRVMPWWFNYYDKDDCHRLSAARDRAKIYRDGRWRRDSRNSD